MRTDSRNGLAALGIAVLTGTLLAVPAHAAPQELISSDATQWQYLDTGVDPAGDGDLMSWTLATYDDSSWASAPGSFGSLRGEHVDVGGNAVRTHLNQYYEGTSTNIEAFFFRTEFSLAEDDFDGLTAVTGTIRFDDALTVWVNGEKAAGFLDESFNGDLGNLQYLGAGNGNPIVRTITIAPELLNAGENTIAVALYQDRDTSSDIYFDFENLSTVYGPTTLEPGQYIATDATEWTYHDSPEDPAGNGELFSWTEADYDDSDWGVERAPFGALRGTADDVSGHPVRTLLTQYKPGTSTNVETFFFRAGFELTATKLEDIALLTGTVRHDDALAVWVNGTKVAGVLDDGFNPAAGNMQYLGASRAAPILSTVTVPASVLQEGTNTVAVALYQDRDTSSDIYFDFETLNSVSASDPIAVTDLVLNVGANETERNVAWYTTRPTEGQVQWAAVSAMVDDAFPESQAQSAATVDHGATHDARHYHHATIDGLVENSEYVYRVGGEQGWSETFTFSTGEFGAHEFSFLMMGDPQLGSSGNLASDTEGWENTLAVTADMFPEAAFIHSVGDQVETASNEQEYAALLRTDHVRQTPLATINGNHDVNSRAYQTHFFMPNLDESYGAASNATQSGGNYWYLYGDVLVIGLNSNNMDVSTHDAFIEKVLAEQGDKASWHVVSFHHSAFSVAQHSATASIVNWRNGISPVLSERGIDLVMMGHDHSYARTFLMEGRVPVESEDASEVFPEEGQTLYVTGNSASGSKYYSIRDAGQIAAADPNGFDYAQVMWQERVPSFSHLVVEGDTMTVSTYRTDTRDVIDEVVVHRAGADDDDEASEPPAEPSEEDLTTEFEGRITAPAEITVGEPVTIGANPSLAGEQVDGYLFSDTVSLGSGTVDASGNVTLMVSGDAPLGSHRLALYGTDGALIGWTSVMVAGADADNGSAPGDGPGDGDGDGDGDDPGDGGGSDGTGTGTGTGTGPGGALSSTGAQVAGLAIAATVLLGLGFAGTAFARRSRDEETLGAGSVAGV